jgi:glucan phosphoethanolaminetransferase (alkaline phosphatase superfamily)
VSAPVWSVFHFPEYMRRRTVAMFFDYPSAVAFVSDHGRDYGANGCYIAAYYPKRKTA